MNPEGDGLDISIVVPAYNEERRLGPTLAGALDWFRRGEGRFEVLVIDDGSRDGTSQLVRELAGVSPEVRLIRLAANRGKGHAVRTGVLNATGAVVLFADADGATPWPEFSRLAQALRSGADIAIGSRALDTAETTVEARPLRRIMGRCYAWFVSRLAIPGIEDTQCGFKLFRGPVAHELFSRSIVDGFGFDVEILMMAKLRGLTIREVPVNWTHQPGSRVNLVMDSLRMLADLMIVRTRAVRGRYAEPRVAQLIGEHPTGDPGQGLA